MPEQLFTPFDLGSLSLSNRVVMAPMTRCRATAEHVPTEIMADFYGSRADAGLLITEGIAPVANGCGYARIPGLWNDDQVTAWKPITEAVRKAGGRISAQLMHTGRVSHPNNMPSGSRVLAPSAVAAPGEMYTDSEGPQPHPVPEAMSSADLQEAKAGYVKAAKNAIAAGFDYVELHGANGYLLDQFLTPSVNQRSDDYGGDLQARAKFVLEVAAETAAAIGAERVGIRLSPYGAFNGIESWQSMPSDFVWLAQELGKLNLAYLHIVDHSSQGAPEVPASFKQELKDAFAGPFILSGGYDAERANKELGEGRGDLVAFGRPFIANPDLTTRFQKGLALNEPDPSTFYTPGPQGYTDYPTA